MEVHPPEHALHSWRDFFVHMGTITLGLLIALSLEGLVEYQHHRHLVHTAHENLRSEVQANLDTLQRDEQALVDVKSQLNTDIQTLRQLQTKPAASSARIISGWTWYGLQASAHNTARDTGALALMNYNDVQRIDQMYAQQRYVDTAVDAYIHDVTMITTPLQGGRLLADTSPAERQHMLDQCSASVLDIVLIQVFTRGLHHEYETFLSSAEGARLH